MKEDLKLVGTRIQNARKEQHISQNELAEKLNISVSHLSAIECGRSNFGIDILMRITEVLKVSADSLLRTDTPAVSAIYSSELSNLIQDCSPAEAEAMTATEVYQRTSKEGEKAKTSRTPVFPAEWQNQFGLPVEEHRKSLQVNIFDGYTVFSVQDPTKSTTHATDDTGN